MGGSGKTTIIKHLYNRVLQKKNDKFDMQFGSLSKTKAIDKLQGDIASALKLDIEKIRDVAIRAAMLSGKLEQKKRWVIIFDDMWEDFNLAEVGVPEPTVDNGCKLILTTRSLDVCRRMDCESIKMELLSIDEAWNLFVNNVGRDVFLNFNLEVIAKDVAKECACLPLAIVTIGSSMKSVVDQSEWRNVLRELRRSTKGLNEMDKVIERLKFSYTRLKDEKLQRCFLYCALYPEDYMIRRHEVITYLIVEEIIEGMSNWQEKCDEGNTILNKLENACLLKGCTNTAGEFCVKMHDVIRDMALKIMGRGSMVKAHERLREFPDKKEWKEYLETVSLMNNVVDEIYYDASPRCNKLKILLLADNKGLTRIPDSFFVHMPSLRLLDITTTEMESLPNSISGLEHLTELRLEWCPYLKYVPTLAKLQGLRVLIISGSAIKRIPQGLEMLVNLQYLDLYWCPSLRFQTGILSKLIRLQCLKISCGRDMNIGEEIASLTKLEILVVEFFVQHDFNNYVRSLRLHQRSLPNSFILMLGPPLHFTNINTLLLTSQPRKFIGMAPSRNTRREDMAVLLAKDDIEEFFIGKNQNLSSLCDVLVREGGGSPSSLLPLQPCTFFGLRKLNIESNGHIKKLFTPQLKPWYQNLEEIYVMDSFNLKEIFSATKGDDEENEKEEEMNEGSSNNDVLITITLPKLRVLKLDSLPIFNSITSRKGIMVCNSIQLITVRHCPNLKRLPLSLPMHDGQPSAPPSLTEIITDDREWWDSLKWDNSIDKDVCFKASFNLKINPSQCGNRFIFA